MIPANVLRPTPTDWSNAWGDMQIPPGHRALALEVGQILRLSAIGACLTELPAGMVGCPLHLHHFEEELFFLLEGELWVRELAPGADTYTEYPLRAGELVAYPPKTGIAHQFHNRSSARARYLGLSNGILPHEVAEYPDSGKTLVRALKAVGVLHDGGDAAAHVQAARAVADARRVVSLGVDERPSWVASPDTLPERDLGNGAFGRPLARAAGATEVFVNLDRLSPGSTSSPLHRHTADEELLLVVRGSPVLASGAGRDRGAGRAAARRPRGVEARRRAVPPDPGPGLRRGPAAGGGHPPRRRRRGVPRGGSGAHQGAGPIRIMEPDVLLGRRGRLIDLRPAVAGQPVPDPLLAEQVHRERDRDQLDVGHQPRLGRIAPIEGARGGRTAPPEHLGRAGESRVAGSGAPRRRSTPADPDRRRSGVGGPPRTSGHGAR